MAKGLQQFCTMNEAACLRDHRVQAFREIAAGCAESESASNSAAVAVGVVVVVVAERCCNSWWWWRGGAICHQRPGEHMIRSRQESLQCFGLASFWKRSLVSLWTLCVYLEFRGPTDCVPFLCSCSCVVNRHCALLVSFGACLCAVKTGIQDSGFLALCPFLTFFCLDLARVVP